MVSFSVLSTVIGLITLQVLLGLGEALGTPAYDAIFAERLDKNKHIRNYTDWKLVSNVVGAVAVILGGILINKVGFSVLFYLMAMLAFISFVGVWIKPIRLL